MPNSVPDLCGCDNMRYAQAAALFCCDGVMPIDLEIPSACDFSMREFEPAFLSQHVSTCLSVSQRVSPLPRRLVPVEY